MLRRTLLVSLLVIFCAFAQETPERESRLVSIAQGPVRGYKDPFADVFVFYNIPYATTPTGPNRYKAPLPPPTWQEPLAAVNNDIICPQVELFGLAINKTIREDCLVANIHVPGTEAQNLPVVVYVHGGAFQFGYGDGTKPLNLVQNKNIIVVTFNYRLGIHGFLCLGTEDAPGNAGMKDQVALLRWVNKNIAEFGGNPHDVTLAGCSAGSASVDLLMLSKVTDGLFNKVILGSGVGLSPFAVQMDPLETAKERALLLNFTNVEDTRIYALEEFYKTVSLETLLSVGFEEQPNGEVIFAPCVERNIGEEMFLDEAPIHTLSRGNYRRLPMIYGFDDMEGLMRLVYYENWKVKMNENFGDFLPVDLHFKNEEEREEVAKIVKEFYFGDEPVSDNNILSFIDFYTDVIFSHGILSTVKMHVENGHRNVYLYEYSFVDDDSFLVSYANVRGAEHCAQEFAFLDGDGMGSFDEDSLSEEYRNMKEVIRELCEPVPKKSSLPQWPPVGPNRSPHMSLGQTVELRGPLLEERANFWDSIYAKYYRTPQPPVQIKSLHKINESSKLF